MALPDLKAALVRATATATAAAALIASPPAVNDAQAQQTVGNADVKGQELFEAGNKAEAFSKKNRGVGIVIYYGASPGLPPAIEIGNKFVDGFRGKGISSAYFVVKANRPGASLSYHVDDTAIGPFDIQQAAANFSRVVSYRQGGMPDGNVAGKVTQELRRGYSEFMKLGADAGGPQTK